MDILMIWKLIVCWELYFLKIELICLHAIKYCYCLHTVKQFQVLQPNTNSSININYLFVKCLQELLFKPNDSIQHYSFIYIQSNVSGRCSHGVIVKAMDCGIVVSEFVLQSCYYVHFQANTLRKGMNPLIHPALFF